MGIDLEWLGLSHGTTGPVILVAKHIKDNKQLAHDAEKPRHIEHQKPKNAAEMPLPVTFDFANCMDTYDLPRCAVYYVDLVTPETVVKANVDADAAVCVNVDGCAGALASLKYYYLYRHSGNHCYKLQERKRGEKTKAFKRMECERARAGRWYFGRSVQLYLK